MNVRSHVSCYHVSYYLIIAGSRPGSTDGDGYHPPGHGPPGDRGHHDNAQHLPAVAPKIRALQHQLKLTDISEAKGSLV